MSPGDAGRRPLSRLAGLFLLIAGAFAGGPASASQPEPPARVAFAGAPVIAGTRPAALTVTLALTAARPIRVRLRLYANPTEGRPLAGGLIADRVFNLSGSRRETIAVPLAGAGDIELAAVVEPAGGGVSDGETLYARVGDEGEVSVFSMAAYQAMHGREIAARRPGFGHQPLRPGDPALPPPRSGAASPDSPAGATRPAGLHVGGGTISSTPAARAGGAGMRKTMAAMQAGGGQLALSGRVFAYLNATSVPLRNTLIEIWDRDTVSPDDLLGTTRTDDNGNYAITVTNDDGALGGGVDVYIYVSSRQAKIGQLYFVPDGEGGQFPFYYAWLSPIQDNITAPAQVINFQILDQAAAASIWAGASRAEWLMEQNSGHVPTYVEVRFPGVTAGSSFMNNIINIDSGVSAPDVAGHEYGHAIMDLAYGVNPGEGGPHYICAAASSGLAWSEGFANYYGVLAGMGDGSRHWIVGDTGVSIENYSCSLRSMGTDELRVSAALWDQWDSPTDNNGGTQDRGRNGVSDTNTGSQLVPLSILLQTLWIRPQNNVSDYWTDLQTRLQAQQTAPSTAIMNYNWFP